MKIIRHLKNKEEGQTLVEFALVLPILLLLLVAVIDFGWIFMAKITMNNAAREGARLYAVQDDEVLVRAATIDAMDFVTMEGEPAITISQLIRSTTPPNYEAYVKVEGYLKPLVGLFFTSNIKISSDAYMKIEYDVD